MKLLACTCGTLVISKLYLLGFLNYHAVLPCLCKILASSHPSADPILATYEADTGKVSEVWEF